MFKQTVRRFIDRFTAGWVLALSGFGWVAITTLVIASSLTQPVQRAAEPVASVFRSVDSLQCPAGFTTTSGRDPDSGARTKTCENERYTITARDDGSPVGLDRLLRRMMTTQEIDQVLK